MTGMTKETTVFDNTFRTLMAKMPEFTIPLINEVFHTDFPHDTPVQHDMDTHITLLGRRHYT